MGQPAIGSRRCPRSTHPPATARDTPCAPSSSSSRFRRPMLRSEPQLMHRGERPLPRPQLVLEFSYAAAAPRPARGTPSPRGGSGWPGPARRPHRLPCHALRPVRSSPCRVGVSVLSLPVGLGRRFEPQCRLCFDPLSSSRSAIYIFRHEEVIIISGPCMQSR